MTHGEHIANLLADIDPAFAVRGEGHFSVHLIMDAQDAKRLIKLLKQIKAETITPSGAPR